MERISVSYENDYLNSYEGYLDFGELCVDKLIHLFRKGKYEIEKENQKQQSYNDYERYRANQHNSYDNRKGFH